MQSKFHSKAKIFRKKFSIPEVVDLGCSLEAFREKGFVCLGLPEITKAIPEISYICCCRCFYVCVLSDDRIV